MAARCQIPQKVRDQFPRSANRAIYVANAWRPFDGHERPGSEGWNQGWTVVNQLATATNLAELSRQGFTWVNLQAGGVAKPHKDVPLSQLI